MIWVGNEYISMYIYAREDKLYFDWCLNIFNIVVCNGMYDWLTDDSFSSGQSTEMKKFLCTWFGEVCYSCSLTVLPGPAWVVLNYVLQRIFFTPVEVAPIS